MNHHLRILEKWIQSVAVGAQRTLRHRKRARGDIQDQQKENLYGSGNDGRMRKQALIGLVAEAENKSVTGQQQRPEQQGAFLPRPEHGKLIGRGQIPVAVLEKIGNREVVLEGSRHQDDCGEQHGGESGDSGAASGFAQARRSGILPKQGQQPCQERIPGECECEQERETSK